MAAIDRPQTLRLGTRGSLLARRQSAGIASEIEKRFPRVRIETILIKTTGDRIQDQPLYDAGGKGLFIKELEQALLANEIDFAVHSCKDMPVTMPLVDESDLVIAAIPPRADPRDLLISTIATSIANLRQGATVGTGSLRRRSQLLARRGDLDIQPVRGNIDTRLEKLLSGNWDALVLAKAGIERAELFNAANMHPIAIEEMIPAAGQGALALQCRRADAQTLAILRTLDDTDSRSCVTAEREVIGLLDGDCHSPIGAIAQISATGMRLRVAVGQSGGDPPVVFADAYSASREHTMVVANIEKKLRAAGVRSFKH